MSQPSLQARLGHTVLLAKHICWLACCVLYCLTVLLICSAIGYRSSQYAASLLDQGCSAANLLGGIVGWVS